MDLQEDYGSSLLPTLIEVFQHGKSCGVVGSTDGLGVGFPASSELEVRGNRDLPLV